MKEIHRRAHKLNDTAFTKDGPVVYWMSRDQRIHNNWALIYADEIAKSTGQTLVVVFTLVPSFQGAAWRHYDFMLKGLKEIEKTLHKKNISFKILCGNPIDVLPPFLETHKAAALVSDFDPLRIKQLWQKAMLTETEIPFWEVDAHNIVPCRQASPKLEYAAYTIRPKINKLLPEYLTSFPVLEIKEPSNRFEFTNNWDDIYRQVDADRNVTPVDWLIPGEAAAEAHFQDFLKTKLKNYASDRNDPTLNGISHLAPYLHFGHISAQHIAEKVIQISYLDESSKAFLEELIVRKELSDNFCFYNPDYDKIEGAHDWAKKTIEAHRRDEREYLYELQDFEMAETHDHLWNAAQSEMIKTGKMHGYMRMYWAKKILEWTPSPEKALETAIYLNDKYSLDGRDPNGYTGCMWSIAGVHDRAWTERSVFGKIRYMNDKGCKRKFNVKRYISRIGNL